MNITVERKYKTVSKVKAGNIIYMWEDHYIITDVIMNQERILVNIDSGISVAVMDEELIKYLNDENDDTDLVVEADLAIRGYLND